MSASVLDFFDETAYCDIHSDVAKAVHDGVFASGLQHFRRHGMAEGRAVRSRVERAHGRIAIAGTGRAGTTALVQLFTALGFETGFDLQQALSDVDPISHAGLEFDLGPDSPLVSKSPWLAEHHRGTETIRSFGLNFVIFPVRSLFEAAESRRRVQDTARANGIKCDEYPGGLWLTEDPTQQESILAHQFYASVWLALRSDLDLLFIQFPRFIREPEYLWERMKLIWQVYGITEPELVAASRQVFDERKVNIKPTDA